jgi:hypothetical protein
MSEFHGDRTKGVAMKRASQLADPIPPSRFRSWLCRHSPGHVYPSEQVLYPGEFPHTFKRGWHMWGPAVPYVCGCNHYDIHCCRACGLFYQKHTAYDISKAPTEWLMMRGCPTNALALSKRNFR